jgi:hypothetical protein
LPEDQTRGMALTVAGQWRIFTAFPNIQLRFLIMVNRAENGWHRPARLPCIY